MRGDRMAIHEYIKVDKNGIPIQPIDNRLFNDEDEIPPGYVKSWQYQEHSEAWWVPFYDFSAGQWIESLTEVFS